MNVLITGTSSGIGFEMVRKFLGYDHQVFAVTRNAKRLLKEEKKYPNLKVIQADINSSSGRSYIRKKIGNKTHIDILINNAGTLVNKPFQKITEKELKSIYETNVFAPFSLIQTLLAQLGGKQFTHIVNIGSMGGVPGVSKFPGLSAYSSSKGALHILTECLAEEFKGKNIHCNCLALGAVQTEMLEKAFPGFVANTKPEEMAEYIYQFAILSGKFKNGKIVQVSSTTP